MQRVLVALGVLLLVAALAWPWLRKLGLFRPPGDIVIERENFTFYFPITTMIIVSVVVSVIFWLLRK